MSMTSINPDVLTVPATGHTQNTKDDVFLRRKQYGTSDISLVKRGAHPVFVNSAPPLVTAFLYERRALGEHEGGLPSSTVKYGKIKEGDNFLVIG